MVDTPKLSFKFDNKQSIEVSDFTTSINAILRQYQKYASTFDDVPSRSDAKLYVKELGTGSLFGDLVPYAQEMGAAAQAIAPYTEDAKKVLGFAKYLKSGFDALLDRRKTLPEVTTKDLKDFTQILEPVAKDPKATFQFIATDGATQNITIMHTSGEANTIQNRAHRQIELMKEPEQKRFNNRLMYWYSATRGKPSKTSDKAIIESVSTKPLPVIISDPEIKTKMLRGKENPFVIGFMVDVELLIVKGEIKGYNILELRDTLENDDQDDSED